MCDYSLGGLPNRLAAEGDELIVHRFPTHSIGLAPAVDVQTKITISRHDQSLWQRMKGFFALPSFCPSIQAVCVPPGASMILKNLPFDLQCKWRVREGDVLAKAAVENIDQAGENGVEGPDHCEEDRIHSCATVRIRNG